MNIGGIVKNSFVDYPNNIACVVFVSGCNFNCWYCHNAHLLSNNIKSKIDEQSFFEFLKTHKDFLDGVVVSGGEPTLQPDLLSFLKKIKNLGFKTKLDTNGSNSEVLKQAIENNLVDYVAMDVKAPFCKYNQITQKSCNLQEIKKSIDLLKQNLVEYEFRTTFSPDLNLEDIEEICKSIKGAKRYSIQAYRKNENTNFPPALNKSYFISAKQIADKYIQQAILKGVD